MDMRVTDGADYSSGHAGRAPQPLPPDSHDHDNYTLRRIGVRNVAIARLSSGVTDTTSAAIVVSHILFPFPSIRFDLMFSVGGGSPRTKNDNRLGSVIFCKPEAMPVGVTQ